MRGLTFAIARRVLETVSLSWYELGRRTWREALDDDVPGLAAQLSYYFFLALFPAILFLLAVASFFPLSNLTDDLGRSLGPFVSSQVLELIQEQMRRLANNENGGLLTVGVAGALWSSSAALVSIVGLDDLMRKSNQAAQATREPFTFYFVASLMFLAITLVSMAIIAWLERRARRGVPGG